MKKIFTLTAAILLVSGVFAQAPQKMSYQCMIRNAGGVLMANQSVGIRITILRGSPSGTVVYQETYSPNPQTNANGLVTVEIGGGVPISGNFSTIDWAAGTHYLKTETDPTGGTSYTITGTSQLLSVPYALYAKTASTADYNDLTNKPTILNSQWTTAGSNIYYNTGKVGIGIDPGSSAIKFRVKETGNLAAIYAENSGSYYTLYAKNLGTGPAAYFDGTVNLGGDNTSELNRLQTGSANILPVCYGSVEANGTKNTGGSTANFTVNKIGTGIYEIVISGETYSQTTHTSVASLGDPGFVNTNAVGSNLRIFTYSTSNVAMDREFSFVVYRP